LDGWGRRGDAGLIAEQDDDLVAAAWYRLFPEDLPGYGFVDENIPEVTIGVRQDMRGRGIGATLLEALSGHARQSGFRALSLSVEIDNPAVRLYQRAGLVPLSQAENAWTMRIDLTRWPQGKG
jgi:GNAT superfamily N-acetyltransferase